VNTDLLGYALFSQTGSGGVGDLDHEAEVLTELGQRDCRQVVVVTRRAEG
jgi:hypothetical protein